MKILKTIGLFFCITMVFFGMNHSVFAEDVESSTVHITDGTSSLETQVSKVDLLVGEKDVFTDVPSVLYTIEGKSRTLVPIRFIVEQFGANMEWDQQKRQATISTEDQEIILTIDEAVAIVNGKKVLLPDQVPAKLLGYEGKYRTMVPLRFIAQQLGMEIHWIQDTTTATIDYKKQSITDINIIDHQGLPRVTIKGTGKMNMSSMYLPGSKFGGSDRLVIQVPNSELHLDENEFIKEGTGFKKKVYDMGIMSIQASVEKKLATDTVKIVIDLAMPRGHETYLNQESHEIKVDFLNTVKDIEVRKKNSVDAIVVHTDEIPEYKVMDLGNRLVVDVLSAKKGIRQSTIPIQKDGIEQLRVSQFKPDEHYEKDDKITRLVLDLQFSKKAKDILVEHEGMDIYIYIDQKPLRGFDYEKIKNNESVLKIDFKQRPSFDEEYDEQKHTLQLSIPKDEIDLKEGSIHFFDNIIQSISIEDQENERDYKVIISLLEGVVYETNKEEKSIKVTFKNQNIKDSKYKDTMIVIDAGHGGKDPGTHGTKLNLQEKDVNLDTAKRLEQLLRDAGFKTYMTRVEDHYVGLYDRAEVANGLGANVFVSIHHNAHGNKDIQGVQVLYNGNDPSRDNKTLAKVMKEEILSHLKVQDRGIVNRPKLVVLRETTMPAVLAEMGFMTNSDEEQRLSDANYRQKCAQALFDGIKRYCDQVLKI